MEEIKKDITINRYPGIKPFSVSEDFLFFGRETDLEALNRLIFIQQSVVLYGKSGYGKSSLINAGIIPKLKENDQWVYFSIRFNNYSEKDEVENFSPSKTVKKRLEEYIQPEKENILDNLMPGEDSFWYWIKQNQLQSQKMHFIIFFDQFEELFTYPKEEINEFSEQLSELLYSTLPVRFKKKMADLETNTPETNKLHDFLYEKPEVKVIFSIRSDRLSLLNNLKDKHPSIFQNCYELDALNTEDARKAIIEPAKFPQQLGFATPPFSFTDKAVNKILHSIANPQDGKVEAATLQIVCRFVEDNLVAVDKLSLIDEDQLGDITDIFQQYYEGILKKLSEEERSKAQHLIEDQLIDDNKRNPLSAAYIMSKFKISDALLAQLEQSSLLRKELDAAGRILYEVGHDTLIAAINKVAEGRRIIEEVQNKIQLERQAEEQRISEELKRSKDQAVKRLKFALIMVVLVMLLMTISIYFLIRAKDQEEIAKEQAKIAKDQEIIAYNALKANAKSQAIEFMDFGDDLMEIRATDYKKEALERYENALRLMGKYPEDSLYFVIKSKAESCKK